MEILVNTDILKLMLANGITPRLPKVVMSESA